MPELPEVQTLVNDLKSTGIIGATITGSRIFWPRSIAEPEPTVFGRRIKQKTLIDIWRRGKFIVWNLSGGYDLLIHLRMTGRLLWADPGRERSKHEHVIITFDHRRQIRFHDTRKFGRLYLVPAADAILSRLGPEPLAPQFSAEVLAQRLLSRRRRLKPLLLDQTCIAGLGNIYVDEALWESKIHPTQIASSLNVAEINNLHRAIRKVLKRGLQNLGTTLGSGRTNFYSISRNSGTNQEELQVFRRTGLPCPRCETPIERIVVEQRGSHVCPHCQKK